MFRLMLIDDEKDVIDLLKAIVEWETIGFEVCSEAYDGLSAIDKVEIYKPDVIIADINMPGINGLKLSEYIIQKNLGIKIVLLTAHNDFNFARHAVNIGVFYYLLKPVDKKELIDVFVNLRAKLEDVKESEKKIGELRTKAELSEADIRRNFLNFVTSGRHTMQSEEIKEKLDFFHIKLNGDRFRVILVEIDDKNENKNLNENYTDFIKHIFEILNSVFSTGGSNINFQKDNGRICSIIAQSYKDEQENFKLKCENIRLLVNEALKASVTIGCGTSYLGYEGISTSCIEAVNALRYKFVLGRNRVISYDSIEVYDTKNDFLSESKRNEILINLRTGNRNNLEKLIDSILNASSIKSMLLEQVQIICAELALIGITFFNENDIKIQDVFTQSFNPLEEVQRKETLDNVKEWILTFYNSLINYIQTNRISGSRKIVEKAVRFIENNYGDSTLSIGMIGKVVHVNEIYLSSLFKKELGVPMVKYINTYRMEKAKEFMDKGIWNLTDVSIKSGFDDQNYFGKCFKKQFGISPSKYIENKQ